MIVLQYVSSFKFFYLANVHYVHGPKICQQLFNPTVSCRLKYM